MIAVTGGPEVENGAMPPLPGLDLPATAEADLVPAEQRGAIGRLAAAYGLGTKAEENVTRAAAVFARYPTDRLLGFPPATDPSWSEAEIEEIRSLAARASACGDNHVANLWQANTANPKSPRFDFAGIRRMVDGMEHRALARARKLEPVEPESLVNSVEDLNLQGAAYGAGELPDRIAEAVVAKANELLRAIAQAGFRSREAVRGNAAPPDVVEMSCRISGISGATVRVINQLGHLRRTSRLGQTAHQPMTLGRRVLLLDSALAQLADDLGTGGWTCESLGLLTRDIRAAWEAREQADPLPKRFARNLFDWAQYDPAGLAALDQRELERLIQSHPDLNYVETLRRERERRAAAAVVHSGHPATCGERP